jgi:hypothetical protein
MDSPACVELARSELVRLNRPLWLFFLVTSTAFADQNDSARTSQDPKKDRAARIADTARLPADETGTLRADDHGTLIVGEGGERALADQQALQVLADDHGTLALIAQQPLADRHGTLIWEHRGKLPPSPA